MDIEQLTKAQIVLLTLLVSFVTSIATGIVTVTLLDQAPPAITQTINRIVERTVERVVPGETQKAAAVITKETTVVVNEEDLVTKAIEKNLSRIAKIYRASEAGPVFVGIGVIVSKSGVVAVATDRSLVVEGASYTVVLSNGKEKKASVLDKGAGQPTALLGLSFTEEDGVAPASIEYGNINALKLGQSVLALYGEERTGVATGVIAGLDENETELPASSEAGTSTPPTVVSVLEGIDTTIAGTNIERGGPLLNIFGEVIGISTSHSRAADASRFTPIQVVQAQIAQVAEKKTQESASEL